MKSPFRTLRTLALGSLLSLGLLSMAAVSGKAEDSKIVGTVSMEEMNVALIASGSWGSGELHFKGKTYKFNISGLGLGGLGVSSLSAYGYVYDMTSVDQFAGVYGQVSTGVAAGTVGGGSLLLKNTNGVILKLDADRQGLALATSADGMVVQMAD